MIRLVYLIAFLPGVALADIRVRTAEHEDFTRIVIDFESLPNYDILHSDGVIGMITATDFSYDLSDVYRRIGEDRVGSIEQSSSGIKITTNCDCESVVAELRNGGLVIDIRELRSYREEETELERNSARIAMPYSDSFLAESISVLQLRNWPGMDYTAFGLQTPELANFSSSENFGVEPTGVLGRGPLGILVDRIEEASSSDLHSPVSAKGSRVTASIWNHLGMERSGSYGRGGDGKAGSGQDCPDVLMQPISLWLDKVRFIEDQNGGEAGFVGAIVQNYIIRGLGAEALAVLDEPEDWPDYNILVEMAEIADGPQTAPSISRFADCSNLSALFSALADTPVRTYRISAITSALNSLPIDIRKYFGRRVEKQLRRIGRQDEADMIHSTFNRDQVGELTQDIGGYVREIDGVFERARNEGEDVARRNKDAAGAIRDAISVRIQNSDIISTDLMRHGELQLREVDGGDYRELNKNLILGYIAREDFGQALSMIDVHGESYPQEAKFLREEMVRSVNELDSDPEFLRVISAIAERPVENSELRVRGASRAFELGAPNLAQKILSAAQSAPSRSELILQAELYIIQEDWFAAERIVDVLDGEDANELRGRIVNGSTANSGISSMNGNRDMKSILEEGKGLVARSNQLRSEWGDFLDISFGD